MILATWLYINAWYQYRIVPMWKPLIYLFFQWQRRRMYTADMGYVLREVCSPEIVKAAPTHARIDGVSWSFSGILLESHSYVPPLHINLVDFPDGVNI